MKLAMVVRHEGEGANVAAVAFDEWDAREATRSHGCRVAHVEKAVRGQLDLRDLPCLLQLLREQAPDPEVILIEGFVDLDAQGTPGLGRHLFHALDSRVAVIGVAKTWPASWPDQFLVFREDDVEATPVLVTCAGIDLGAAKARLRAMHGRRRVPTLLKLVARMAKGGPG